MALRAYIARRPNKADTAVRKRGDVVSVHLAERPLPSANGATFRQYIVVENWNDATLEAEMRAARITQKSYPYATYVERTLPDGRKAYRMSQMATRFVDFTSLSAGDRTNLTSSSFVDTPRQAATLGAAIKSRAANGGTVTRATKETRELAEGLFGGRR